MHISEGILSTPILLSGAALALAGTGIGLKKMDYERIPETAILSAGFFVASLVHIPLGPANVHLILNGLMGLFLGWVVFPAILVGLLLQALLFQYGGFTTLGVNCISMSLPAVACYYIFGKGVRSKSIKISYFSAFMLGFLSVLLAGIMVAVALLFTGEQFLLISKLILVAHVPVMIVEGLISLFCVIFIKKVRPEILGNVSC